VTDTPRPLIGTILAGGRARRMGGADKGLLELGGRPLIEWVIEALLPQVDRLVINANRNAERYAAYGFPVIADAMPDYQGPLAGLAAAMDHAAGAGSILTVPCDSPVVPPDIVARLSAALARGDAELAVAHDGERLQPVHALVPVTLRGSLAAFLAAGERKVDLWYARHRVAVADFSDCRDCFANLNRPRDLDELQPLRKPG
jgi:molybdenum cofactor guanylyltransferase